MYIRGSRCHDLHICAYISQKQKSVHYDIWHYIIISSVSKRISNAKSLFLIIFISSSLQPFFSSFASNNGFFRLLLQYLISRRKDGKPMNRLSISIQNTVSIWQNILHFWSNWTRRKHLCRSIPIYCNNDTAHRNTTRLCVTSKIPEVYTKPGTWHSGNCCHTNLRGWLLVDSM